MDLLQDWINDGLQLSSHVREFEIDFANGYLIGEILYKTNQQKNFSDFIDAESSEAKIINFCLLEPTMRAMNIRFEPTDAAAIMNHEAGAAAKIIYQIKMIVDQRARSGIWNQQKNQDSTKGGIDIHNMPSHSSKPQYDANKHLFFEKTIRVHMKSDEELHQDRGQHLAKEHVQERLEWAKVELLDRLTAIKEQRLHEYTLRQDFHTSLDIAGHRAWRANKKQFAQRQARIEKYRQLVEKRKAKAERDRRHRHEQDVIQSIDTFESHLKALCEPIMDYSVTAGRRVQSEANDNPTTKPKPGHETLRTTLNDETGTELYQRMSSLLPTVGEQQREIQATMKEIAQKRKQKQHKDLLQERRRTKFVKRVLQRHVEAQEQLDVQQLVGQIQAPAHVEQDLTRDRAQIQTYFGLMASNRERMEQQVLEQEREDHDQAQKCHEMLDQMKRDDFEAQMKIQTERYTKMRTTTLAREQQRMTRGCQEILHEIIDLTLKTVQARQAHLYLQTPDKLLPLSQYPDTLAEYQHAHEKSSSSSSSRVQYQVCQFIDAQRHEPTEDERALVDFPANPFHVLTSPGLPSSVVLGECIKHCRTKFDTLVREKDDTRSSELLDDLVVPPRFPIQILLVGRSLSGRKTHGTQIAKELSLAVFTMQSFLEDEISNRTENGLEALASLQQGRPISDEWYIQVLRLKIHDLARANAGKSSTNTNTMRDNRESESKPDLVSNDHVTSSPKRGWILCDFPTTLAQAQMLENMLTGMSIISSERQTTTTTTTKHDAVLPQGFANINAHVSPLASGVAFPLPSLSGKSGLTKVLHLSTSRDELYARYFGSGSSFDVESKPTDLSLHVAKQDTCLVDMCHWFSPFEIWSRVDASSASAQEIQQRCVADIRDRLTFVRNLEQRDLEKQAKVEALEAQEAAEWTTRESELRETLCCAREESHTREWTLEARTMVSDLPKLSKEELSHVKDVIDRVKLERDQASEDLVAHDRLWRDRQASKITDERELDDFATLVKLTDFWNFVEHTYVSQLENIVAQQHELESTLLGYLNRSFRECATRIKEHGHAMWHRTNESLFQLQFQYNALDLDMRQEDRAKAEFHCRVDRWIRDIETLGVEKKTTHDQVIEHTFGPGNGKRQFYAQWVVSQLWMDVQSELDRFHGSCFFLYQCLRALVRVGRVEVLKQDNDKIDDDQEKLDGRAFLPLDLATDCQEMVDRITQAFINSSNPDSNISPEPQETPETPKTSKNSKSSKSSKEEEKQNLNVELDNENKHWTDRLEMEIQSIVKTWHQEFETRWQEQDNEDHDSQSNHKSRQNKDLILKEHFHAALAWETQRVCARVRDTSQTRDAQMREIVALFSQQRHAMLVANEERHTLEQQQLHGCVHYLKKQIELEQAFPHVVQFQLSKTCVHFPAYLATTTTNVGSNQDIVLGIQAGYTWAETATNLENLDYRPSHQTPDGYTPDQLKWITRSLEQEAMLSTGSVDTIAVSNLKSLCTRWFAHFLHHFPLDWQHRFKENAPLVIQVRCSIYYLKKMKPHSLS